MSELNEKWLDLRSDTVTRPSAAMRAAMNAADVGDDVYGDDPTVNHLQEYTADLFGYEDALFAPSGTQSNLLALLAHCGRGDEYLVGQEAHTYRYEGGGAAVLGSIQPQPIINQPDGSIALADIAAYIKPDDFHFARTKLLALENTIGGRVLGLDYLKQATTLAHERGLATHLDGARVCNAAVKLGVSPRAAVAGFDSVSVCLSKGLGAPIGSVLCGSKPLIAEAKRWRKMLGGGMRQAGMIAAGGMYALQHNFERLSEDHDNATYFASELAKLKGLKVSTPQTNIFYVDIPADTCRALNDVLQLTRIRVSMSPHLRIVTHMDASREDIDRAITVFGDFFG
ncbi:MULTISPECIES: low-specificity L-threonine aldolase [unclassified Duganella]|uniref:low-specificity L-threonine aldolase n=1 Tax=unclassified Duganella TaxID=2636909 RepID=UPI000E3442E7|nr:MULTISPECIES: low-specificity L-threonine aldolase [unclassified Duganella]RFP18399.1 low-specificity L-threonine aldolase [Duganella sp. BJB475]RFP35065.1 low-specificity L-threonine aldolase [Duganella sp. BJB476]